MWEGMFAALTTSSKRKAPPSLCARISLSYSSLAGGVRVYKNAIRSDAREMVNTLDTVDILRGKDRYGSHVSSKPNP